MSARSIPARKAKSSSSSGSRRGGAVDVGARRREWLADARLYFVVDVDPPHGACEQIVRAALRGGVDVVQLRDKRAADREIVLAARDLRRVCDAYDALLIVNDRPDLALACGADGVHVGQDDTPVAAVRRFVGPDVLIGLSTHSPDQIAAAGGEADYIGVGPVFATDTKPGLPAVGVELVAAAASIATRPFFAIGGIDRSNAAGVVAAGASRLACVRAIRDADDPCVAAAGLRALLPPPDYEGAPG